MAVGSLERHSVRPAKRWTITLRNYFSRYNTSLPWPNLLSNCLVFLQYTRISQTLPKSWVLPKSLSASKWIALCHDHRTAVRRRVTHVCVPGHTYRSTWIALHRGTNCGIVSIAWDPMSGQKLDLPRVNIVVGQLVLHEAVVQPSKLQFWLRTQACPVKVFVTPGPEQLEIVHPRAGVDGM